MSTAAQSNSVTPQDKILNTVSRAEQCPGDRSFQQVWGQSFIRKNIIYPTYFSGGGVELILDELLATDNFRHYENAWRYLRIAREFLETLPFWEMQPRDDLLLGAAGKAEVFAKPGEVYAVYLPVARATQSIQLSGHSLFHQYWFNPRTGGKLQQGSVAHYVQ